MKDNQFAKKIVCIGAGYVGGPTMVVIANKCPDYKVTVVDISESVLMLGIRTNCRFMSRVWRTESIKREAKTYFSTDIDRNIAEADIIFVSVHTPTKTFGEGAGKASDLQYWTNSSTNQGKLNLIKNYCRKKYAPSSCCGNHGFNFTLWFKLS